MKYLYLWKGPITGVCDFISTDHPNNDILGLFDIMGPFNTKRDAISYWVYLARKNKLRA